MYRKWAFCILAASLLCPNSAETHPESFGKLRARRDASEEEGPSPEYLFGSILSHKAVTGLLGKVVDIPVKQAIEEDDPDSPWANFDFGGLVELGLQMGGRALQGEKNLFQGRDTAQKVAGVLSRVPKSRRELALEARQAEREQAVTETKPSRAPNEQLKQVMGMTMEGDYDDVQDIGMARVSNSDGSQSKAMSVMARSRQEKTLGDDYGDIQDIDNSRGSNGGSGSVQSIDDDIQDVDQSLVRGTRNGKEMLRQKARVFTEKEDQHVTDLGISPDYMIDDDIQDVEGVPHRSGQREVNKRQGQAPSFDNDYVDDHENSFLDIQDVVDRNNIGSTEGGKGANTGHSQAIDYGDNFVDDSDDIQDVVESYDIDSRYGVGGRVKNYAAYNKPPPHGHGMGRHENGNFLNAFKPNRRERAYGLPVEQNNDGSYHIREAYGSQQVYKRRQPYESNRNFNGEHKADRSHNSNSFGGRRNIPFGGYGAVGNAGKTRNAGHWEGRRNADHVIYTPENNGWNFRGMHSYGSNRIDDERERGDGEPVETIKYPNYRPKQERRNFSRGRYGHRQSYDNDRFIFGREESDYDFPIEHQNHHRYWPNDSRNFNYNENEKYDDGDEDYGENDNFNYDDEGSDFVPAMSLQQPIPRYPYPPPYFRKVNDYVGSYSRKPMY